MNLLNARTPEELVEEAEKIEPAEVETVGLLFQQSLSGSVGVSRSLVVHLRSLARAVAEAVDPAGRLAEPPQLDLLVFLGTSAPATGWVAAFGFGRGSAAYLAASALGMAGHRPPAPPPGVAPEVSGANMIDFERRALAALRDERDPLEVMGDELGLGDSELGRLFGVSRQAVRQWRDRGIPSERLGRVGEVLRVVQVMSRKLKPGRVALVSRRPAAAFGGRSLLEVLAEDPREALEAVEDAFDWSGSA